MSLNKKIIIVCLLFLVCLPTVGIWYYRKMHPKYIPPPPREEVTITIIPGWNLRQIADYLVEKKLATSTEAVFSVTGKPVHRSTQDEPWFYGPSMDLTEQIPAKLNLEGYLAPETYRVFKDASLAEGIIDRMIFQRDTEINAAMREEIKDSKKTIHQIVTMASIIEKETKFPEDRSIVADILWRRVQRGIRLQVDSTVHYLVNRSGDVFTTGEERQIDSPWNTYKYAGLPPGPIASPSVAAINAALHPQKNDYWYFLSDDTGHLHYARTLEEQNANARKYLR